MADELAKLIGERFIQRKDVKALQFAGGGYTPERSPITWGDIRGHIAGSKTMGHYLVDPDGMVKLFAFDIDLVIEAGYDELNVFNPRIEIANPESPHRELLIGDLTWMAEGLARVTHRTLGIDVAIAWSGNKGVHVYGFTGELPAADARFAARSVLDVFGCFTASRGENFFRHETEYQTMEIEVFPKQDNLEGKDLGNLMRLPLGVNKKSKQRGFFLRVGPTPRGELHEMDPIEALSGRLPWE